MSNNVTFTDFYTTGRFNEFEARFKVDLMNFLNKNKLSKVISTQNISLNDFEYKDGNVQPFEITSYEDSGIFTEKSQTREIKSMVLVINNLLINETDKKFSFNVSSLSTTRKNESSYNLIANFTYSFEGRHLDTQSFVNAKENTSYTNEN